MLGGEGPGKEGVDNRRVAKVQKYPSLVKIHEIGWREVGWLFV